MLGPTTAQYSELVDALLQRGPAELRALAPGDTSYAEIIAGVAVSRATAKCSPERLAWLLTGIGFRESSIGAAADLVDGTGDFGSRIATPKHIADGRHQIIADLPALLALGRWSPPRDEHGGVLSGPYAIPLDGLGYGRSEWQHDFDAHPEVVEARDGASMLLWRSARWACDQAALRFLADLEVLGAERMALAAYNCGVGGVRRALSAGVNIDTFTTGSKGSKVGDYSRWILDRLQGWGVPA